MTAAWPLPDPTISLGQCVKSELEEDLLVMDNNQIALNLNLTNEISGYNEHFYINTELSLILMRLRTQSPIKCLCKYINISVIDEHL